MSQKGHGGHHKRQHAKRRALQRFGIELNRNDFAYIRDLIQQGKAQFMERQTLDRTKWRIQFKGVTMDVIYSKRHKSVATVLYPE